MARAMRSQFNFAATQQMKLGAPFTSVQSVGGEKDSDNLTEQFSGFAATLWDRLVAFRDFLALFLLIFGIHLALVTRQQSGDTPAGDCAVNSYIIIFLMVTTIALLVVSNVIRSLNPFSVMAETVLGLLYVAVAIVLASATGPFRWQLAAGVEDVCSAATNPHSALVYLLADVLGTGSVLLIVLSTWAKPFVAGNSFLSVVIVAVVAVVVQYTLLELWLVPEIATVWKEIEANGTSIDTTLKDITDRLVDVETLFNITVRR